MFMDLFGLPPTYTYLALNLGTVFFPLLLSFDKKVAFYKSWPALFPSILWVGAVFLIWDEWFTVQGVWGFNPDYLVGVYGFSLPMEEWLFFLTVPYACLFIYACLHAYIPRDILAGVARPILKGLVGGLIFLAIANSDQLYTVVTFLSLAGWLALELFVWRSNWLGRFLLAYLISLVPFLLVNGVLTALPVVWYNDAENFGLRLTTIPIEDTMYMMLLLLMNTHTYEWLMQRRRMRSTQIGKVQT